MAENADRERCRHTRSTRESSSEACLKHLVLSALGYTLGLTAEWCLLILRSFAIALVPLERKDFS